MKKNKSIEADLNIYQILKLADKGFRVANENKSSGLMERMVLINRWRYLAD